MQIGVLYIHGFTGNTLEVMPIVEYLQEKEPQWIVSVPTLTGHGTELRLRGVTSQHWLRDVENAYRQLQSKVDKVIVVGFSMGGMLAMYLALRYPVEKLVLLSASAKYIAPRQLLLAAAELVRKKNRDDENVKLVKSYAYKWRSVTLPSLLQFLDIVHVVTPYLQKIDIPVFIVQGEKDGIVPKKTADFLYNELGTKKKEIYFSKNGYHHICYSDDRSAWFQEVHRFICNEYKKTEYYA
ncbi:alpha/beta hydrolase [Kurthia sibirica]|uniref:Carboxylesterase n=1 Tax=Kurthia sibirica TaxID=202750 RepID=A0A2U3AK37_9BACL|nr:alpha/beta fold hydrolase [Kurthia sibirica]PWI24897.1 carboxylesterase [Kurthia sibirica]GEK33196.1 carboxylesterase [Kurthia sibirica]